MKKNLLSVSIALMMSAAAFTSCVDNNESDSVKGIRDAKAEQLKSLAGMYNAQGEAELIRANFEKAYKDAQTAMLLLENEEQSMANEIKKASLLHDIEIAIAKAKADLAKALEGQAANEAALKVEADKVFGVALTNYTTAFNNLYGGQGASGYVNDLQSAKLSLISLKNDLISIERWVAGQLKTMNEDLVALETKRDVYTSMSSNDLEKLKAELSSVEVELAKAGPANIELDNAKTKALDAQNVKSEYLNVMFDDPNTNSFYYFNVSWNGTKWEKREVISNANNANDAYEKLTTFVYNPSFAEDAPTYIKNGSIDPNRSFDYYYSNIKNQRTSSPYSFAALNHPAFFKSTNVSINPIEFVIDAKLNRIATAGGGRYTKFELIDAEGYKKVISDKEEYIKELDKAKDAAIVTYNAAKTATAAAKTAWETATDANKPAKEALYTAAKLQSNIARLEMDYAKSFVDGGKYIYCNESSSTAAAAAGDVNSKTATGIDGTTIEGIYDQNPIVVTSVVTDGTNTITTTSTYVAYGWDNEGQRASYNTEKADYDLLVSTGAADYQKAIDEYVAANTVYANASKDLMISEYAISALEAKESSLNTLISQTQDIPALLKTVEENIVDKKAAIENINNLTDPNENPISTSQKELAIAIQEQEIVKLNTSIAVEEAKLKKYKAEIDALTK